MNSFLQLQPKKLFTFLFLLCAVGLSSCVSYKNVPYFQDLRTDQVTTETINNYSPYVIQPKDELLINVSSLDPETAVTFGSSLQNSNTNQVIPIYQYLVDQNGEIKLPLIGVTKVAGLTPDALTTALLDKLKKYLKDPRVTVRILNFKVAVMGDVQRPNVYTSYSDRLTITEALSMAGDLNITGKRDNIFLIREENGKREYYPVDLTSKKLFDSPYFYLKSNDLIFVQPSKLKVSSLDNAGYRNTSLIISALSVIATFAYLVFHK